MSNNMDKARRMVALYLQKDYAGNVEKMEGENGDTESIIESIFFWLEDGNGDGLDDDSALSLWTM